MSVSDPLIKNIKGYVARFLSDFATTGSISDENPHLLPFCEHLEIIFQGGLLPRQNAFGFNKTSSAWNCIDQLAYIRDDLINFQFVDCVEQTRKCYILTNTGKLRYFIRQGLSHKCLYIPVQYWINKQQINKLYQHSAILGDEILVQIFLSVLLQCSKINFKLHLNNVSFLNLSWSLPDVVRLELVPCESLGLTISFADDKAVIVGIKPISVIAECGKVNVGDILDNLNGIYICSATKGKLSCILNSVKGKPVNLTIIKFDYLNKNDVYVPIIPLLKQVNLGIASLKNGQIEQKMHGKCKQSSSGGFHCTYIGSVETGRLGDSKQIDKALKTLLTPFHDLSKENLCKIYRTSIRFEIGEIGVKIIDSQTSSIILKHSYMEISACGSSSRIPYYLAYIAGNEYCNKATHFTCYIFHVNNNYTADTILQSIGQGFHRTHFAV